MLDLYKKNIFRVTGLPVDASSKEVSRQVQKLQMLEEMGGGEAGSKPAFSLKTAPTSDEIREALSRMKEPEHRLIDEFFWFWPEEFGASKEDPAIQAMLSGDKKGAYQLWKDREKAGSHVAQHNMAIIFHMYAVDWTNQHISSELDEGRDKKIKKAWETSFERWEPMIDNDELWDMLKERVRSVDDEALTTGFVRRMLKQLPEALDRVNAEAALKLAEQGRMDWAKFHINFMRETHQGLDDVDSTSEMILEPTKKRVEQHLESFTKQVEKSPRRGADLADELLDQCRPMMDLFDLFHGEDAHQRNDLFDSVAEAIFQMSVAHQKSTGDNKSFVDLLQRTLKFASGATVRERIIENISIGEGNLKWTLMEPVFEALKDIMEGSQPPSQKLASFQKLVMPKIPSIASEVGADSTVYGEMMDTLAHALRGISVDAYNNGEDTKTAEAAIQLALRLVVDNDVKKRIQGDLETIQESTGTATCFFCGSEPGIPRKAIKQPMYKIIHNTASSNPFAGIGRGPSFENLLERSASHIRYSMKTILVPRCANCCNDHKKHWVATVCGAAAGLMVGLFITPWGAVVGAMLLVLSLGGWIARVAFTDTSQDNSGCGVLSILLAIGGAVACVNIAEDQIGSNFMLNMLGGALLVAFVTFWIAKKVMHKASPGVLAVKYGPVVRLGQDGWKLGEKPEGYS